MNMLVNQYLPSLSESWLDVVNQWVLRRSNLRAKIASGNLNLQWNDNDFSAPIVVIRFTLLEHRWAMALQNISVIDARLHGEPFMLMPEALRTFTLQKILSEFLAQFSPATIANLQSATIEWTLANELESWQSFPFDLFNETQATQSKGLLFIEKPHTLAWFTEYLPFEKKPHTGLADSLDIQTKLHLGVTRIPLQQLKQLSVGDLVWIEHARHTRKGLQVFFDLATTTTGVRFQADWQRRSLTVARESNGQASISSDSHHQFTEHFPMQIEIDQLNLPISFDLGELSFPLSDIERIAPDYVFELPCDAADATVNLRIHGKLIAQGSLVTVGKRLAVRLTKICTSENNDLLEQAK